MKTSSAKAGSSQQEAPGKKGKIVVTARMITTYGRMLEGIDIGQARRFKKLGKDAAVIAMKGISRHIRACRSMDINIDVSAIREIMDDALDGRKVYEMEV